MNGEGYKDPTADIAIKRTGSGQGVSNKVYRVFLTGRNMVELSGFRLTRLEFRDRNDIVHHWRK